MSDIHSNPYRPNPARCCEACCFGRGEHAEWCPEQKLIEETARVLFGFEVLKPVEPALRRLLDRQP